VAGSQSFEVAGMQCMLLGTGRFAVDGRVAFAAPQPELADLDEARGRFACPDDPLTFEVHPLFIETGSHRIVVDPGSAGGGGSLCDELWALGVAPESIDTVILTHGHADHWSSSVVVDGEAPWDVEADRDVRPAFPNARYVLQHAEWEHWFADPNPEPVHAAPFRNILGPIRERFDLVKGHDEIAHGIEIWPAFGHSPGHQVVMIGEAAMHIGDVLLHPICVEHPNWPASFDVRPDQVVATRLEVLSRIVDENLLVLTHHFAWPGFGRIRRVEGRRRWEYARV
jgi:glyoxylase-like metal-dependent hydrolase (beta-lactamase superfamily II)